MIRVDALCLLSTGHLLRILIALEEPPHLTAGFGIVCLCTLMNEALFTYERGGVFTSDRLQEVSRSVDGLRIGNLSLH